MFFSIIFQIFLIGLLSLVSTEIPTDLEILGIEPQSGPVYGETRVIVRLKDFNSELIESYPHPSCRFGSFKYVVNATYVKCTSFPREIGLPEPTQAELNETCIQCGNSPPHSPDYVPFTISLIGDFTDVKNSIPFRYFTEPVIKSIYPRYGPKDGGTLIEVYGENFLNYDQNLRCGFGSLEVKGYYVNNNYMICYSPKTDVIGIKLPFTISLNNQQNTKQFIPFLYYSKPQVFRIENNKGPDTGDTLLKLRGQNFDPLKEYPDMNNYNDTFCKFGNLSISQAKVISSTEIECKSPASYEYRQVPVEITLNNREWTGDRVMFNYYHPPFIYFISPKIGPNSGGTNVTITGSNFVDTGYVMCRFGNKYAKGEYINENELICTSPQVEKPGIVGLSVAIREDEFSSGTNTKYKYYATPEIDSIEPMCGPERGFTQITINGSNFPIGDSDNVKCVFNRKLFLNATVMSDTEIKCDSPSVLNSLGVNEFNVTDYDVEITLNGVDINGPKKKFYYYKETSVNELSPIYGPLEGNTKINITGANFHQKGACNITVRFATYQVHPVEVKSNYMIVNSPQVNFTGAVVVQVALNGRDFDKDITVNYRDEENTYYYYKIPRVLSVKPNKGTTLGNTELSLEGVGFLEPFYAVNDANKKKIYYRFVDCNNNLQIYTEPSTSSKVEFNHNIKILSPKVFLNNTLACIQLSYNDKDYVTLKQKFQYYTIPNITEIIPRYGPMITSDNDKVKVKLDNYYCSDACEEIVCRYKSKDNSFIQKGYYVSPNTVNCTTPKVNIPDTFNIEVSFNNGEDFTNNGMVYTFYDPYVIRVEPQMVSSHGGTKIKIYGYGFADSGENLKVQFGSKENSIKCNYKRCIKNVEFISANVIEAETFPRNEILYDLNGKNIGFERIPIEVSVYNDDFTNNNVTIFYYDEPDIIKDLFDASYDNQIDPRSDPNSPLYDIKYKAKEDPNSSQYDEKNDPKLDPSSPKYDAKFDPKSPSYDPNYNPFYNPAIPPKPMQMDLKTKKYFSDSLVKSVPSNIKTMIPIPIDTSKLYGSLNLFTNFANFTCLFQMNNDTSKSKITYGIITSFPPNIKIKNLLLCQSPSWDYTGPASIKMSLNGFDFSETEFLLNFTDPIGIVKIEPSCGPKYGGTDIQVYGTGFERNKDFVLKWGPQNLVNLDTKSFIEQINGVTPASNKGKTVISKINVKSPIAPNHLNTVGGVDYISISQLNFLALDDDQENKFYSNNYIHTNFEYFYYKQPYVQSFSPKGSILSGRTQVLIIGAWFQDNPQYGVRPYCKFGNKIVLGRYLSTVRILCEAPAYSEANVRVPLCMSLNKHDWECFKEQFTYYNDFKNAKFEKMIPHSGPSTGGTQIKIFGKNFTNLVTPEEFLCEFRPDDSSIESKKVPAGYQEYPRSNQTAIICNTPGGWLSGTKSSILISFDGQNFMDTNFDFYFYKVEYIKPRAGPTTGNELINIIGGGFKNSSKVSCILNKSNYKPISISEKMIKCPMPPVYNNNTGSVEIGVMLNGIDPKIIENGFYYYEQAKVESIYPKFGPSKGNPIVKVYGKGFRNDFPGAELGCKIGRYHGEGNFVSENEMECVFNRLPLLADNSTMNFSIALNNYSFTQENSNFTFTPYGIFEIKPSAGPFTGGTRIEIRGAGFFPARKIRCRFGVPGYYVYTEAEYINYNLVICNSPESFKLPSGSELPYTVPFSIAFNDDEFQPWTQTSHFFSFTGTYSIESVTPVEGSTKSATLIKVFASNDQTFSLPSASVIEEDLIDYTDSQGGSIVSQKKFIYQPLTCRFGRFGITVGEYVNKTLIKCLTPNIQDDSDVGYEEVQIEIALNGVDYLSSDNAVFTFIGPNSGKMLWVYILITVLVALIMIGIAALVSSYWNKIVLQSRESNLVYSGDQPHVIQKQPRYLIPELRPDLRSDLLPSADARGVKSDDDKNRRDITKSIV